ncbi:hypothetical protein GOV12_05865 [Candidatus Pacearchaeota archaeon]|nr:hypothetical protein [Candidatus Pacearchaeota archaeon]
MKSDDNLTSYEYRNKNFKSLRFGTSGLRDIDDNLTDMQVYLTTKGFLNYLFSISKHDGGIKKGEKIAIAGDLRPTTNRILVAVSFAILDSGCNVDYCGKISTPALILWGFNKKIPSIMVTASHNPIGQNGLKFSNGISELLRHEESIISREINQLREFEYHKSWDDSIFDKIGFFKKDYLTNTNDEILNKAKIIINDNNINKIAKENYINRYKKIFNNTINNQKIVFYEQTSVARDIIPQILEEMGIEVIKEERIDEKNEFISVDTENLKKSIIEKMANLGLKNNTNVVITTDGDGDRPVVIIIKKNKEKNPNYYFIKGDRLNVLASIFLKPDHVSIAASVTHKHVEILKKHRINVRITKLGSSNLLDSMNRFSKNEKDKSTYGFEFSGGAILGSDKKVFNGDCIKKLPTRDSILPIVCVFALAKSRGLDIEDLISEIFSGDFEFQNHTGLIENLPGISVTKGCEKYTNEIGKELIENFSPKKKEIFDVIYNEDKILPYNDNEELIELNEENINHLIDIKETILNYVKKIINDPFVKITKINYLEGLRIHLSNDEFIYIRSSGNACQFRIYAEAKTENRAVEIVNNAIYPESGTFVDLINDFINGKITIKKPVNTHI